MNVRTQEKMPEEAYTVKFGNVHMLGTSSIMWDKVYLPIQQVASTDVSVLIKGESGTGKELVARALHYTSRRQGKPFVAINCAAIPSELLESELFGYKKGSFSGAAYNRDGIFMGSDKGVLFLDEVTEMSTGLQAKLLRAVETGEFRKVGEDTTKEADVRILSSTNRDLARAIREGNFREDLYYRLAVVTITVPPLRERGEDIGYLIHHFMGQIQAEHGRETPWFTPDEYKRYQAYEWPGNIRQLKNAIERIVIKGTDKIAILEEIQEESAKDKLPSSKPDLNALIANEKQPTLAELERLYLLEVVEQCNKDRKKAARILGIDLKTIYRKLKEYGNP